MRSHLLRLRGGEVGFGLANLIADLALLIPQRGGAFGHLRGRAGLAGRVKRVLLLSSPGSRTASSLVRFDLSPSLTGSCSMRPAICGLTTMSLVVTMPVRTSGTGAS